MFFSTSLTWSVSLTIIHRLHSELIPVAIFYSFLLIDIEISVKPLRVLMSGKIFCTIYFAYFLLGLAQHTQNICASLLLNFYNCYNVVLVVGTYHDSAVYIMIFDHLSAELYGTIEIRCHKSQV